jgi:hypothetical protein
MDEIRKLYGSKGYYAAKITYEIDYGEKYEATVNFVIDEPQQSYVRKIAFTGNKNFKDSKLQGYMQTREKGWFSWFTGSGILDEDVLQEDRRNLEAFYHDNGYTKVHVGDPISSSPRTARASPSRYLSRRAQNTRSGPSISPETSSSPGKSSLGRSRPSRENSSGPPFSTRMSSP